GRDLSSSLNAPARTGGRLQPREPGRGRLARPQRDRRDRAGLGQPPGPPPLLTARWPWSAEPRRVGSGRCVELDHRGTAEATVGEGVEGAVGVLERVRADSGAHVQAPGETEELLAVGARVGGDRRDGPLPEQVLLVVEPGYVAEVDPGDGQRPALLERRER